MFERREQCERNLDLSTTALEVLACIALKQPISQAEIDRLFDAEERALAVKLRDLKLKDRNFALG